jgi:hypothetical protein
MAKGTGKIIHEEDQEEAMTEQLTSQILGSLAIVATSGKRIMSCQIHTNVGWRRKAIVIRFDDGTGLRISGTEMEVMELGVNDVPARGEWPEDREAVVNEAQLALMPPEDEDDGA